MSLDLDAIEREARAHLVRCGKVAASPRDRDTKPGIVPDLCETILALVGALRREQAKGRAA